MDRDLKNRLVYRELRSHFNRLDLRLTTIVPNGARISYVPNNITVVSTKHPTKIENRIQCLIDIIVQLGIAKTGVSADGTRRPN